MSATVFVAGGVLVVITTESLREGPLPIVGAIDIVLLAAMLGVAGSLRRGKPEALARLGCSLALAGLAVALWFFAAVVLLEGLTGGVPQWRAVPLAVALVPQGRPEGQMAAILSAASGLGWAGYVLGVSSVLGRGSER